MLTFKIRPHHLLCNLCFQGKGYNERFTQNFISIHSAIKHQDTTIKIVAGCDDICMECPNKEGNLCHLEEEVTKMDNTYLTILQLKFEQTITLQQLKTKIKNLLTIRDFHSTCQTCSWYRLNLCTPIIEDLIQN